MTESLLARSSVTTAALFLTCTAGAQVSALEFDEKRLIKEMVFHYLKSNVDGSHAGEISVFVEDGRRIESLKKWSSPPDRATLVVAEMDWPRFSVGHFQSWELNCNQLPLRRATLDANADGSELRISVLDKPVRVTHWPWHSYDFDFASLSVVLPHVRDPQADFVFWRTDFIFSEEMRFEELGEMRMTFEANEPRNGKATRRYSMGGPGIGGAEGTWWSDASTGLLVEFEIPVPDEPGYKDVRLRLQGFERMTKDQWTDFKQRTVCSGGQEH